MTYDIRSIILGDEVVEINYVESQSDRFWKMAQVFVPREIIEPDIADVCDSAEMMLQKAFSNPGPDHLVGPPDKITQVLSEMTGLPPDQVSKTIMERLEEEDD